MQGLLALVAAGDVRALDALIAWADWQATANASAHTRRHLQRVWLRRARARARAALREPDGRAELPG